jgi:hypothetical protein
MAAISDGTGVKVETKRESFNDDAAAQYVKEIAMVGGALTVRGIPLEVKRLAAVAAGTKNGEIIAIIDV